ncbi:MAG: 7-cyano-7-deazaguanine synthase QueC [Methanimicrococcus sp.]|nr:7-cyano-7-deazaguanine synthase QueC [Methanimicrococcus sp.]
MNFESNINSNEGAVIVFSGGQDSTTCLEWAVQKYGLKNVFAVIFDYGQRHRAEIINAERICQKRNIDYKTIQIALYQELMDLKNPENDYSLLSKNISSIENIRLSECISVKNDKNSKYPNTFVPARNLLFLVYAGILSKFLNYKNIVIGVSQTDFNGYPDCRAEFIKQTETVLKESTDLEMMIHAPLIHLSKAETWKLAEDLGVLNFVKEETITCYNGIIGDGCGDCPSCRLRAEGYRKYLENLK